jgi:hypothetical protein
VSRFQAHGSCFSSIAESGTLPVGEDSDRFLFI